MSNFEREKRYIVIKLSDLKKLPKSVSGYANSMLLMLANVRPHMPRRECLVIESDWPEYEPAWQMIERRMTGKTNHVGVIVAKTWLDGAPRAATLYGGDSLPGGAFLYLAPPASPDLAAVTLQILKEAKDIPDGLYARAKHLAKPLAEPVPPAGGEPDPIIGVLKAHFADGMNPMFSGGDLKHLIRLLEDGTQLQAELTSANANKEAYAQNAIDLRKQLDDARRQYQEMTDQAVAMMAERDALQSELTKARELLEHMLKDDDMPVHWFAQRIDEFLAHQSAPASKDGDQRRDAFVRLNSAPHCPECGHPDCNGQCYGDDMMGDS